MIMLLCVVSLTSSSTYQFLYAIPISLLGGDGNHFVRFLKNNPTRRYIKLYIVCSIKNITSYYGA